MNSFSCTRTKVFSLDIRLTPVQTARMLVQDLQYRQSPIDEESGTIHRLEFKLIPAMRWFFFCGSEDFAKIFQEGTHKTHSPHPLPSHPTSPLTKHLIQNLHTQLPLPPYPIRTSTPSPNPTHHARTSQPPAPTPSPPLASDSLPLLSSLTKRSLPWTLRPRAVPFHLGAPRRICWNRDRG